MVFFRELIANEYPYFYRMIQVRLLLLFVFSIAFSGAVDAQILSYYDLAKGKQGTALKAALHDIIDGHKTFPYTSSSTDVWDILKDIDQDPNNSDNVILIYSGASINGAQEYNSGNGWTREHVWAKSRGDFGTSEGAGTDVHHLRPADQSINSARNNRNFDDCVTCSEVKYKNSGTNSYTDMSNWTFEPRDEVKGDVARMIFYMALRYEVQDGLDLEPTNTLLDKSDKAAKQARLSTLLKWHELDKVDDYEKRRNELIHKKYQGNRNPFIDQPELAEHIFGSLQTTVWPIVSGGKEQTLNQRLIENIRIEGEWLQWENNSLKPFKVSIYNTIGQVVYSLEVTQDQQKIDLSFLRKGIYYLHISIQEEVKKIVKD